MHSGSVDTHISQSPSFPCSTFSFSLCTFNTSVQLPLSIIKQHVNTMHALHHFIIQLGRVGGVTMKTDVVTIIVQLNSPRCSTEAIRNTATRARMLCCESTMTDQPMGKVTSLAIILYDLLTLMGSWSRYRVSY